VRLADDGAVTDRSVWREHGSPLLPRTGDGPLNGLGVAVKDLFAVGGFPIGAGNPAWLAGAAREHSDAPALAALRAAGAAVAGIAQTDELAFSLSGVNAHYGAPPNPAAPDRVSGGSTSGPASAVAAGTAEIGLGTDTAGSIRVPASVCGLFGLRPTHGAVSLAGVIALAPSFDTVGWLARDAGTLRAVGSVLLPAGPVDRPSRLLLGDGLTPGMVSALGARVEPGAVLPPDSLTALLAAFRTVQAAEAWGLRGEWITSHPGALGPEVEARFRAGAAVNPDREVAARATIAELRAMVVAGLGDDTWLALPAAGGPGPTRSAPEPERDAWRGATLRSTVIASACGLPSVVVPTAAAPPLGLALVGPPGADRALLAAANALDSQADR
jgi:Asp-tRNA(Asn)/Glu-tRNA(Gln) amidotransferase A subunit family amidase